MPHTARKGRPRTVHRQRTAETRLSSADLDKMDAYWRAAN